MTPSRLLLWSLALALVAGSVWAWPGLPDRIPLHFGVDGLPDRWGERSVWGWFLLPGLAVALAAATDGLGRWALRHPERQTINLPQSKDLYALPVERRVPVLQRSVTVMNVLGVVLLVALGLLHAGTYAAAHGEPSQVWTMAGLGVCLLAPMAVLVWGITSISNELDRQKEAVSS